MNNTIEQLMLLIYNINEKLGQVLDGI